MEIIKTVGLMVASLAAGMGLFYVMSSNEKTIKKQQLEDLLSYIVQFIIYIWLGKIIVFLPKFIHDPLSVLAYPSDSKAFYLACIFILLHLLYKWRKKTVAILPLFEAFSFVWIGALFFYQFLGIITQKVTLDAYFIGTMGLFVVYILIYEKILKQYRDMGVLFLWALFSVVISFVNGYVVLFGYLIKPGFFILLVCLIVSGFLFDKRQ